MRLTSFIFIVFFSFLPSEISFFSAKSMEKGVLHQEATPIRAHSFPLYTFLAGEGLSIVTIYDISSLPQKGIEKFLALYTLKVTPLKKRSFYSLFFLLLAMSSFFLFLYSYDNTSFSHFLQARWGLPLLLSFLLYSFSLILQIFSLYPSLLWGLLNGFSLGFFGIGYLYYLFQFLFFPMRSRNEKIARKILRLLLFKSAEEALQ